MKQFIKNNFVLLLAFTLPLILIIGIAISTYLPSLFLSTDYNFIYTACNENRNSYPYNCNDYLQKLYSVVGNKLVKNNVDMNQDSDKNGQPDFNGKYDSRIFLHNTQKNESREITLAEAEMLMLNGLLTSPDGVTVSSNYSRSGGNFFIFDGGHSSYGYYLMKGKSKSRLNLINNTDYYYQNNFQFLGWVLPGRN